MPKLVNFSLFQQITTLKLKPRFLRIRFTEKATRIYEPIFGSISLYRGDGFFAFKGNWNLTLNGKEGSGIKGEDGCMTAKLYLHRAYFRKRNHFNTA